jgi:hypothetical protein
MRGFNGLSTWTHTKSIPMSVLSLRTRRWYLAGGSFFGESSNLLRQAQLGPLCGWHPQNRDVRVGWWLRMAPKLGALTL